MGYVIDYLTCLESPGGGRLLKPAFSQVYIPAFPPNTYVSWTTAPQDTEYCAIGFALVVGTAVVPNAFQAWIQQYGSRLYEGIITQTVLGMPLEVIYFMSKAWPAYAKIQNLTNVGQFFESLQFYLIVANQADLATVMDHLKHLSSYKIASIAGEANTLLKNIWRQLGGKPK